MYMNIFKIFFEFFKCLSQGFHQPPPVLKRLQNLEKPQKFWMELIAYIFKSTGVDSIDGRRVIKHVELKRFWGERGGERG